MTCGHVAAMNSRAYRVPLRKSGDFYAKPGHSRLAIRGAQS